MTSLKYEKIYSDFLGNIKDPTLANLEKNDAYELLSEYLHKSLAKPTITALFKNFSINDEVQIFSYELKSVDNEDTDKYFVQNVLGKAMAIEWLEPKVNNNTQISQLFTNKEQQFYSQSSHLSENAKLLESNKIELKKLIRDRGYICNGYINPDGGNS